MLFAPVSLWSSPLPFIVEGCLRAVFSLFTLLHFEMELDG